MKNMTYEKGEFMVPKQKDLKITVEFVYRAGTCEACGANEMVQFANDGKEIVGLCRKHANRWDYR